MATATGERENDRAQGLIPSIAAALRHAILPGEEPGFDTSGLDEAAAFVAGAAAERRAGTPSMSLESIGGEGRRHMRLAIVNDDMPFLVDSVAATISAHDLAIDRIIHPVVSVRRDGTTLTHVLADADAGERRESLIYMEIERADARLRRTLLAELETVLADVRAAVADWPRLQEAMKADAERAGDGEGAALLRWFVAGNMTLLGHEERDGANAMTSALGVSRTMEAPILAPATLDLARGWFADGGAVPLIVKSNQISTIHRRVPMDVVVLPRREGGRVTGLSLHAGLWTSAALAAPPMKVPVLRTRLAQLQEKFDFDPAGHAGKSLAHAMTTLPHDLLVAFDPEGLERVTVAAMSIADRPRVHLATVGSALDRHLFCFVWLPRDELTTDRRLQIGNMLVEATGAPILNWALALEDGVVALLRFTLDMRGGATFPDADALDRKLGRVMRGWSYAVETALGDQTEASRAARLALRYAAAFPQHYRTLYDPEEAALDTLRLGGIDGTADRDARFHGALANDDDPIRLKVYSANGSVPLSDIVPALENFGFRVVESVPIALDEGRLGFIHDFLLDHASHASVVERAPLIEKAVADVLSGRTENDVFNRLVVGTRIDPRATALFRAWFRYLRQTGLSYGYGTVVDALTRAPDVARALVELFAVRHDPSRAGRGDHAVVEANAAIETALVAVAAADDDRILRLIRSLVNATLRTNAFAAAANEALAFKFDSHQVPGLPAPLPWREIFVYSPRVEGIHLRAGPVARGGLRWSDRRDDFRTEILGLMKAQRVKNAVIVPTGAKGGFYAKQLPDPSNRDAWLAEGTEAYRIFIRTLLSITDNIVEGQVVHPENVVARDGPDPYFVVAADKGTAAFSDVANAIALERGFWLGDAFASGGSNGYDHKAMGITAKGAWVSVQRHFAEAGIDVQADPVTVVGVGDMSGDVFGNGMLLSETLKIVAAFDHRHIFLDPTPDAAASFAERQRMFALPRSSWDDYDKALISLGGGVFPRGAKTIDLSPEAAAAIGIEAGPVAPSALLSAILKAPVDLIWFGGIGTYVKARAESNSEVGDPANDGRRVNGEELRAQVVGEGANLGVTQAARIAFAAKGGRINTDFIDNSAGVDCSDNEVNIKIVLNGEMTANRLSFEDRNALLGRMTDEVSALVLEDNRLQTLALSIAEAGGSDAVPSLVRLIETLEAAGRLDRAVEGLGGNDELLRRMQEGRGLTRPELAVVLATAKLDLQDAIEGSTLAGDDSLLPDLLAAFPTEMQAAFGEAIANHQLRREIVATKLANLIVNRMGLVLPFELSEEEGATPADVALVFVAAVRLFDMQRVWADIDAASIDEPARIALFDAAAAGLRLQMADLLRTAPAGATLDEIVDQMAPGLATLREGLSNLLRKEAQGFAGALRERLLATGAPVDIADPIVRLYAMDGGIGLSALAARAGADVATVTRAFTALGEALGLDWAQGTASRLRPSDPWERLLVAGLARDFQQLRIDFLARHADGDPEKAVADWLLRCAPRIRAFTETVRRARATTAPNAAMLAQIAGQARVLLGR